jgi:hypothetical protein
MTPSECPHHFATSLPIRLAFEAVESGLYIGIKARLVGWWVIGLLHRDSGGGWTWYQSEMGG